jgi:MerR family copper efflux transcriptional regulator
MDEVRTLSIGQIASQAGVGVETVRFYEREGLIPVPARRASGYRQYDEQTVARLRFIRRAKELGFTLNEIASLLSLRHDPQSTSGDVKREAERQIANIESKIRSLQRIRRTLKNYRPPARATVRRVTARSLTLWIGLRTSAGILPSQNLAAAPPMHGD